jgi:transcriptional regulator with XRE-family HTH domain
MIGDDIKMKREQLGMSQEDVAQAVGTTQQTIQRIEANKSPRSAYIPAIVSHLGVTIQESASADEASYPAARSMGIRPENRFFYPLDWRHLSETIKFRRNSGERSASTRDLKLGQIPILELGEFPNEWAVLNRVPIDFIERGEPLLYAPDGYAVKISSNDMYPALKAGEIALVNPTLSPLSNEPHMFISAEDENQMAPATVGYLQKATPEKWLIEKFNPAGNFELYRDHFPICHRIVGKFTRR